MPIGNGIVQSLIRNDPAHLAAPGPDFELMVCEAAWAVSHFFPIWDVTTTFEQRAARGPSSSKAEAMAATFITDVPVLVGAWRRRHDPSWAQPGAEAADDLIIFEGNHRMLAIALRASWNFPLPPCIGVFVRV